MVLGAYQNPLKARSIPAIMKKAHFCHILVPHFILALTDPNLWEGMTSSNQSLMKLHKAGVNQTDPSMIPFGLPTPVTRQFKERSW